MEANIIEDAHYWYRVRDHYVKRKKEEAPKISVIVPTYNQAHILIPTLQSIIDQKNVTIEIILVDGGSTDHTFEQIEVFKRQIYQIYYVTTFNLPLMVNKGVFLATGDYVCILLPGHQYLNLYSLSHISQVAYENKTPHFIFSGNYLTKKIYDKFTHSLTQSSIPIEPGYDYAPFSKMWLERGFFPTAPCSMWFRTDLFKQMEGLNYNYIFTSSLLDFLCRIFKDQDIETATTFWSTTANDVSQISYREAILEHFYRGKIIYKNFGLVTVFLWFFRKKPYPILNILVQKIYSFFKEER